jgi:hypothetical protein
LSKSYKLAQRSLLNKIIPVEQNHEIKVSMRSFGAVVSSEVFANRLKMIKDDKTPSACLEGLIAHAEQIAATSLQCAETASELAKDNKTTKGAQMKANEEAVAAAEAVVNALGQIYMVFMGSDEATDN